MMFFAKNKSALRSQRAYTLVEILTATGLMLVLVFGLVSVFNQTQRAFRGGLRYVDVTEGNRAAMDLIAKDVQQMGVSQSPSVINMDVRLQSGVTPAWYYAMIDPTPINVSTNQTNIHWIQNLYFLASEGRDLKAMGYRVLNPADLNNNGEVIVGTLYRFWTNTTEVPDNTYFNNFSSGSMSTLASQGRLRRILDGVVHFQATPFDAQGRLFTNSIWGYTNHVVPPPLDPVIGVTNENFYFSFPPEIAGTAPCRETFATQMTDSGPTNALPAYVEIEIGTLEPQIVEQLKPITNVNVRREFIKNHAGHIHIFRQQIPVRPTF